MCGICGFFGGPTREPELLDRMAETLIHRGPDRGGRFDEGPVHLAIRRLRVIDLQSGDQPITNEDGSVVVVYNGEIYNHRELRADLESRGHRFRTRTDTEVLVHLWEEYGERAWERLNGMFAFALWDRARSRLVLVRDPVGIKPLFLARVGETLVFGSEVKSVLAFPGIGCELDPTALHQLLNVRFVPPPRTLFAGVESVPPGTAISLDARGERRVRYREWEYQGHRRPAPDEVGEEFLERIQRAVDRQLLSDVPVGVFLSGGIDSSSLLLAASRSAQTEDEVPSFSLGFDEPTDEIGDARLVAEFLQSRNEARVLPPTSMDHLPRAVFHAEQPKVNATQIDQLAGFARESVTVALGGLGGDELFYGYEIYRYLELARRAGAIPGHGRILAPTLGAAAKLSGALPGGASERLRRPFELAAATTARDRYLVLRNAWDHRPGASAQLYRESWIPRIEGSTADALDPLFDRPELPDHVQVQRAEFRGKMVADFLLNDDRMTMANSLESRVPYLDHELIEFAFSLDHRSTYEPGELKPLPRSALRGHLPDAIVDKPKWGFTFDSYHQFTKDLRSVARCELTADFLSEQGIFRPSFVRSVIDSRPSPGLRRQYFILWMILGLKFWQEIFQQGRDWREIQHRVRVASGRAGEATP